MNQQIIKSMHKKQIFTRISNNPGISRVNLAREMSVSKTTVSALVDELIQERYVIDAGAMESKRQGRKPQGLTVNHIEQFIIVVNCFRKRIEIALLNTAMETAASEETVINADKGYLKELGDLFAAFEKQHASQADILGVCIIIPGIIDEEKQEIFSLVLPLADSTVPIEDFRNQINGYPLAILNDTACLAYAESIWGTMKDENGVYININQGIGAALISEGKMFRGANGMTTQFGHTTIDVRGEQCYCGNRGCLENAIGELALEKRIAEYGLQQLFADKNPVLFRDVGTLADTGNEEVLRMLDGIAEDFSQGLNNLITLFHPKRILIGGMGRKLGTEFLEKVRTKAAETGFKRFVSDTEIQYTKLGEEAVLQGAAKYFLDMHFNFSETKTDQVFVY